MNHYNTVNIKQKRRRNTMSYLTTSDIVEIMEECGDSAVVLLQYYINTGGKDGHEFTDEKTGIALKWHKAKVQRIRLKLEKAGYFLTKKFTSSDGSHMTLTYIGKDNVKKGKTPSGSPFTEIYIDDV